MREVPIARVETDTPFLNGVVEALCPKDVIYDVIIGNVPGAREPNNPDFGRRESGAVTRAESEESDR